ncbi:MAG: Rab family GTPase [Promethearchaeota archaeon]
MSKPKVFKIIIAGDGGVGKTTLLHRYIEGKFIENLRMTIGVEFFLKTLEIDGLDITLQIWDFGGQQRFRFLLKNYARGAKGSLLLFDPTRPITLKRVGEWVEICRSEDPNLPILFIGSKSDLEESIILSDEFFANFRQTYNFFDYLRISSKTGENVDLAFRLLTKKIIHHVKLY